MKKSNVIRFPERPNNPHNLDDRGQKLMTKLKLFYAVGKIDSTIYHIQRRRFIKDYRVSRPKYEGTISRFPTERTSAHREPLIANLYALYKSGLIGQDQYNRKVKELRDE